MNQYQALPASDNAIKPPSNPPSNTSFDAVVRGGHVSEAVKCKVPANCEQEVPGAIIDFATSCAQPPSEKACNTTDESAALPLEHVSDVILQLPYVALMPLHQEATEATEHVPEPTTKSAVNVGFPAHTVGLGLKNWYIVMET